MTDFCQFISMSSLSKTLTRGALTYTAFLTWDY